ncbi:MAG: amidase [Kofleriaceae bacterium]|nr:amidase [Myxococcales bacterium]MCB9561965.1 amidase [Kofleriaceae bacterium]MCB9573134.1 amidase [Kofleriaceae bacterium]
MQPSDYLAHDALGLAELVRTGEVHPRELVEEAIRRIEQDNPRLNAVIHRMYDSARAAAERPRPDDAGPFWGVPFLAKDLVSTWQGEPQASGTRLMRGWVAPSDTEMAARYRKSGVIVVGKTNTPELGILPVTEPVAFGPTRNPWDTSRTPGGSSGGSGAAVAAGLVPIAGGGDGGGSIRIPSSCCGLFGLKPTRARTPIGPDVAEAWQGCAIEHVLVRSVRDSAAMLDAVHGPDPGAPYVAPPPARPFLDEVGAAPGRLRIAYTSRALIPAEVDPACVRAVEDAAALLRDLGHDVVEDHPEFDAAQLSIDFVHMLVGETAADVAELERVIGRKAHVGDLEKETLVMARLGAALSASEFAQATRRVRALGRRLAPFFARYDLLLTPTLAQAPVAIGALASHGAEAAMLEVAQRLPVGGLLHKLGAIQKIAANAWGFAPFTAPFNATGQPACNLPLYWTDDGLPVGVQLVGRFGDEATLLRVASQAEVARPWRDRRPPGIA